MRIKLVCLEDGITSCGFRKISAFISRLHPDTESCYVSTGRYRSLLNAIRGSYGGRAEFGEKEVDEVARSLADADVVGFSSMTGYADLTRAIVSRIREISPQTFLIWGGIHSIIHPEDAIKADVDAICTGEGEFAFQEFFDRFQDGRDYTEVENFWFKRDGDVIRNRFRTLMTNEEMESLPFAQYGSGEKIYKRDSGFVPMEVPDYLANDGLGYTAIWSIGCPFHCSFCGNTKFIANDPKYKSIRHPSARYIVEEVKQVRERLPHVSQVSFHDDSFMALPYREIETFAELWKQELDIPFAVYGVIPNYVRREKFEILTWAGMNRIRMGVQSGSKSILDFYKRPTPPEKVLAAVKVNASFSPKHHIPPTYDIIMDNPIETRQDVVDTLELLYEMDRPFTLLVFSLKVIPNTDLERLLKERGVDIDEISDNYSTIPPRIANLLLYVVALWRPPRWLFERMLKHVEASGSNPPEYPVLGIVLRTLFLLKRAFNHLRRLDFSIIPGWSGYVFWRLGLVSFWWRRMTPRMPRPEPPSRGGSGPTRIAETAVAG